MEKAHARYFAGDLEGALDFYGRLRVGERGYPEALYGRALILEQLGRSQEALEIYRRLDVIFPRSSFLHRQIGWAHLAQENSTRAALFFSKAIEEDPADWEASLGLAWTLARQNQFTESLSIYQKTLALNPDAAILSYFIGRLFERMGKNDAALLFYDKASQRDPLLIEARLARADLLEREGRGGGAVAIYRRLLRLMPGSRLILRSFRRLAKREANRWEEERAAEERRREIFARARAAAKKPKPVPFLQRRVPMMRIGLGADGLGRPAPQTEIQFSCRADFDILDGPALAKARSGKDGEVWTLRVGEGRDPSLYSVFDGKVKKHKGPLVLSPQDPDAFVTLKNVWAGGGSPFMGQRERTYRGVIEVHRVPSGLQLVNQVPLEDYLTSVVPSEMEIYRPIEALKAQAIIARCNAVDARPHRRLGYDLCDGQHCQVYSGVQTESRKARRAVTETRGEVLVYRGRTAHTVFSSNCGGHTQDSGDMTGWGDVPYWQGRIDGPDDVAPPATPREVEQWIHGRPNVFCRPSAEVPTAESRWARLVPIEQIEDRLAEAYPDLGRVTRLIVRRRARSGHVNSVEVVGTRQRVTLEKEHRIRNLLAPGSLRSTLFTVQTIQEAGRPAYFLFWGGGWGHGVGLCQSGAAALGAQKKTYKQILLHYYPQLTLGLLQE